MSEIGSLIAQIAKSQTSVQTFACVVEAVNKEKRVCDVIPINGDAALYNVRLKASIDDAIGVVVYPKIGSKILVSLIENKETSAFVSLFDEIESVYIAVSSVFKCHVNSDGKVELEAESVEVNGGLLGGFVKVQPLVDAINRLEGKLNQHIDTYNSHVHPASGVVTTMLSTAKIPVFTKRDDLENSKIKH